MTDGRTVTCEHDHLGRRIAKRINRIVVEKYLWQSRARLPAVFDASDLVVQRFEYADSRVPVAMCHGGDIQILTLWFRLFA